MCACVYIHLSFFFCQLHDESAKERTDDYRLHVDWFASVDSDERLRKAVVFRTKIDQKATLTNIKQMIEHYLRRNCVTLKDTRVETHENRKQHSATPTPQIESLQSTVHRTIRWMALTYQSRVHARAKEMSTIFTLASVIEDNNNSTSEGGRERDSFNWNQRKQVQYNERWSR